MFERPLKRETKSKKKRRARPDRLCYGCGEYKKPNEFSKRQLKWMFATRCKQCVKGSISARSPETFFTKDQQESMQKRKEASTIHFAPVPPLRRTSMINWSPKPMFERYAVLNNKSFSSIVIYGISSQEILIEKHTFNTACNEWGDPVLHRNSNARVRLLHRMHGAGPGSV